MKKQKQLNHAALATAAAIALLQAGMAKADLTGSTLHLDYRYPGINNIDTGEGYTPTNFVVGSGQEVTNWSHKYMNFDVSSNSVLLTFSPTSPTNYWVSSSFNGWSLSDATGSSAPSIMGVTVDTAATNMTGLTNSRITFDSDHIYLNWGGLNFSPSTVVKLNIASAAGGNWLNATNTNNTWARGANWSNGAQPTSSDDANFTLNNTYNVALDADGYARNATFSAGNVTFATAGHTLGLNGNLTVATTGLAALTVKGGGNLDVTSTGANDIGQSVGSNGTVAVNGSHLGINGLSTWLGVGHKGTGNLYITNGGTVQAHAAYVGYDAGTGLIDLTDAGSTYSGAALTMGGNSAKTTTGTAVLNIRNGTMVDLTQVLTIYNTTSTAVNFTGGTIKASGLNLDGNAARFHWTGGTFVLGGGHISNLGGATLAIPTTGVFNGTGTVDGSLQNGGTLSPGNSPGLLTINGDLIQLSGGVLSMELAGLTRGVEYDALNITGTLWAAGALNVSLDGFTPHVGDSFDLFDVAGFAGDFDSITLAPLPAGLNWDITDMTSSGVITVVPEPSETSLFIALSTLALWTRCRARRA